MILSCIFDVNGGRSTPNYEGGYDRVLLLIRFFTIKRFYVEGSKVEVGLIAS